MSSKRSLFFPDRPPPAQRHLMPANPARGLFWLRALGRGTLPETLRLEDGRYVLLQTLKHDFYAATGLYESETGRRVVLKVGRTVACAGIPLKWLGRRLRDREVRFYRRLADIPNIPRLLAVMGDMGFVHEFVPGQPLSRCVHVPDGFFDELVQVFRELHRRDVAYVDAHKKQNVIVGEDGSPHLIDFQISADLRLGNTPLTRWLLRKFQRADVYHALKHKSRLRPDELTAEEEQIVRRKSLFIRIHRVTTRPYQKALEWTLRRWEHAGRIDRAGDE